MKPATRRVKHLASDCGRRVDVNEVGGMFSPAFRRRRHQYNSVDLVDNAVRYESG